MKKFIISTVLLLLLSGGISIANADKLYADNDKIYIKKSNGEIVEMQMPKSNEINGFNNGNSATNRPTEPSKNSQPEIDLRSPNAKDHADQNKAIIDEIGNIKGVKSNPKHDSPIFKALWLTIAACFFVMVINIIRIILIAFSTGIIWGLTALLTPFIIIFVITHWEKSRNPFLQNLVAGVIAITCSMLAQIYFS
jgi:hypothetical protein